MKKFFRFLRNEINGKYLVAVNGTLNKRDEDTIALLKYLYNVEFKVEDTAFTISNTDLKDLANILSCYSLAIGSDSYTTSIKMTDNHIVGGVDYSERGLYNTNLDEFEFFMEGDTSATDINTLATTTLRSSLVEDNATPLGYIAYTQDDILDASGNVIESKLYSTPPENMAYSEYYGNKYQFLMEDDSIYTDITSKELINYIKVSQNLRMNGCSTKGFFDLVNTFTKDIVKIKKIEWSPVVSETTVLCGIATYTITTDYIEGKNSKVNLWKFLCEQLFPQIFLKEEE